MRVAVWQTGHEIADRVAASIYAGCCVSECNAFPPLDTRLHLHHVDEFDLHIGYGILRGMGDVFKACQASGKPFIHIDRGYWKPGHYDGYYRFSLNGTQQTFGFDKLLPDYERWEQLGIEILPFKPRTGPVLTCPATEYVAEFFNVPEIHYEGIVRAKNCQRPLQEDLDACGRVITFNSSVGWEALRQGIPVVSDPIHSIVGNYQKTVDKPLNVDYDALRRFFAVQASLQLTLNEVRSGALWPLITKLLACGSDMMDVKPSPQT